ncbi:MAG: S8 family serine peptidase [Paludibacteraceae bacterium]|nr:S8 family serine peptidase [Paludibacteraceae bacterium]
MLTLIFLYAFFVSFTDKPADGAPALSERALEQRAKWNISTDDLDYPVNPAYLDSLRQMGVKIYHTSRWFNGATCEMSVEKSVEVEALDFVENVEMTRSSKSPALASRRYNAKWQNESTNCLLANTQTTFCSDDQLALYNLHPLHQAGFEGQGILMTICDGGFHNADTLSCFRQTLELGHFDLTDDTVPFYGDTGDHGTKCLSTISAITTDYYGAATQAQYYLMRSEEDATESPKEMDNLVAAFEKADSLGTNIFSVSLGYTEFDNAEWDLPKNALDGRSTRVSLAATIAARKGMLVCVAAGNEGDNNWHTMGTPSDADSILSVGAVDTNGLIGSFSSYGPSADGRVKPDVCAVGVSTALFSPYGFATYGNGTSFATPLLAGLAACLWSALPDENAMSIRERIIRSADHYSYPDMYRYGYGIPDAWKAYTMDLSQGAEITVIQKNTNTIKILHDGRIIILRNNKKYNLSGQLIK